MSHHFDEGIPYQEAYNNGNWPAALLSDIRTRLSKTPVTKKILLSASALALNRNDKAPYSAHSTTLATATKNQWQALPFNDARVVRAYSNFMKLLIDSLRPAFVNYAVENNVDSWNATTFAQYRDFVSQVYQRLKTDYPATPILLSFIVNEPPQSLNFASQLVPYTDYMALSAYPYTHVRRPMVTPTPLYSPPIISPVSSIWPPASPFASPKRVTSPNPYPYRLSASANKAMKPGNRLICKRFVSWSTSGKANSLFGFAIRIITPALTD